MNGEQRKPVKDEACLWVSDTELGWDGNSGPHCGGGVRDASVGVLKVTPDDNCWGKGREQD